MRMGGRGLACCSRRSRGKLDTAGRMNKGKWGINTQALLIQQEDCGLISQPRLKELETCGTEVLLNYNGKSTIDTMTTTKYTFKTLKDDRSSSQGCCHFFPLLLSNGKCEYKNNTETEIP